MREGNFEGKEAAHRKVLEPLAASCVQTAEPIEMPFGALTRVGTRKHVLDGGACWRNLATTIESSMCDGDAVFLLNYFDHLLFPPPRRIRRPNRRCLLATLRKKLPNGFARNFQARFSMGQ